MKNRPVIDLLWIFAIYVIYCAVIYLAHEYDMLGALGVNPADNITGETFRDDFRNWNLIVMGVSLFAVIAWYVLGEWGPRAQRTSSATWILIWVILLVLVLLAAFAAVLEGPHSDNDLDLGLFFFGGGVLFFWIATMCFSPVGIKTIVPGSKLTRRW